MKLRKAMACVSLAVSASALTTLSTSWAHDPSWILGGSGTASIDGVLSAGEWDRAGSVTFDVNLPAHDTPPGTPTTTPATMFVMNDAVNLYVAFRIQRGTPGLATNPALFFDADHDTLRELGDDGYGMSVGAFEPANLRDTYVVDAVGNTVLDTSDGGTNDGATAASADGTFTYIEISHPLDSLDDAHDFSLAGGDIVGFGGSINLFSVDTTCTPNELGDVCQAFTDFAGSFLGPIVGDIFILSAAPGACERDAVAAREYFINACMAAGGSRASCTRVANEIFLSALGSCHGP